MGFAVRNGWIAENPVTGLERDERPHPPRREQRVLAARRSPYAHLFDEARHSADIRAHMANSAFVGLLAPDDERTVIRLPPAAHHRTSGGLSARERAGIRWAT